jgi:hypothetical protein
MRIHFLLDFTQGDLINIRICAIHYYEIDPIDIDSKYVHTLWFLAQIMGNWLLSGSGLTKDG